jgi:glycosidase
MKAMTHAGLTFTAAVIASIAALAGGPSASAQPAFNSPIADEVFYHFMPISWRDSNNDTNRFGDFAGMTASLDYLQSLGVTSVWMNPIFPSPAYHGYQHGPADQIDPDFGTQQQFLDFVAAAKARNIKVYLDFVVYGISQNSAYSPYFTSAFNNPASIYDSWLAFTNAANTQYLGSVYNTWNGASVGFIHWDLRTPAVSSMVTAWARKWLDPNNDGIANDGIAGYRFDHCWVQYNSGPDGWGYNLDDFWTPFFASLKQLKPDVFNFGEQADWGTRGTEFLSQFDGMFTIPFQFAARTSLTNANNASMISEMDGLTAAARTLNRGTFLGVIGTHDVDRLSSVIGGDTNINKNKAAAAVLMLQPFAPVIYYGDELGMKGLKGNFGSDANDIPMREPMKWNAVAGAPMSNYWALNSQAFNARYARDNDGRSVQEQTGVSTSVLETYRSLINLRKNNVALRRGDYTTIPSSSTRVWSFLRRYAPTSGGVAPNQTVMCLVNMHSASVTTSLNLSAFGRPSGGSATVTDLVVGGGFNPAVSAANAAAYSVTIPTFGFRVLSADLTPPPPPVSLVDGIDIPASMTPASLDLVQNSPTSFGDGIEIDRLMVRRADTGLFIGIPGNLAPGLGNLAVLLDVGPGGQSSIYTANQTPPPAGLIELSGMTFDPGYDPDFMFFINAVGSTFYVDQLAFSPGTSVKTYRGNGTVNSGSGFLSGGTNPEGIQIAFNNTNTGGVTGFSAANALTATTGFEMFVPYAALGLTAPVCSEVRVSAFISDSAGTVSTQHLPALNTVLNPGISPGWGSAAFPGFQYGVVRLPASCAIGCAGDINNDGTVNTADLTSFLGQFGQFVPPNSVGDVNTDGTINTSDLTSFLGRFGTVCP